MKKADKGKQLDFLFWMSGFLVGIAIILDFIPLPYISPEIEGFFSYDTGNLITALLTVWVALTALVIYYMGKKDERYYGVANWKIIFKRFEKKAKMTGAFFLIELVILLLAFIIRIPITLIVMILVILTTVGYAFKFAMDGTDESQLGEWLQEIILEEYSAEKKTGENQQWEVKTNTFLVIVLKNIDYQKEENLDFLIDLFEKLLLQENAEANSSLLRELIEKLAIAASKMNESNDRILFFQNLVYRVQGSQEKVRTILRILYFSCMKRGWVDCGLKILEMVSEEKVRRLIWISGVAYNIYLDDRINAEDRVMLNNILKNQMKTELTSKVANGDLNEIEVFFTRLFQIDRECFGRIILKLYGNLGEFYEETT